MKRILATSLVALALAFAATPSMAQLTKKEAIEAAQANASRRTPLYLALSDAYERGDVTGVFKAIDEGIKGGRTGEQAVAAQWLFDHSFGKQPDQSKFNAFYFMFLADIRTKEAVTAQQLGKVEQGGRASAIAVKSLMAFEILAVADSERCGDPTVLDAVQKLVSRRYNDLKFSFKTLISKEQFDRDMFEVIQIESDKSARPVNTILCNMGELAAKDPNYKPPVEESTREWSAKRHEWRSQYKSVWTKMYYKMIDAQTR